MKTLTSGLTNGNQSSIKIVKILLMKSWICVVQEGLFGKGTISTSGYIMDRNFT